MATLLNVVNNIVQHCWAWISPQSGVTILNNIVDNIEQCWLHNTAQPEQVVRFFAVYRYTLPLPRASSSLIINKSTRNIASRISNCCLKNVIKYNLYYFTRISDQNTLNRIHLVRYATIRISVDTWGGIRGNSPGDQTKKGVWALLVCYGRKI